MMYLIFVHNKVGDMMNILNQNIASSTGNF